MGFEIDYTRLIGSSRPRGFYLGEENKNEVLDPSFLEITMINDILKEFFQQFPLHSLMNNIETFHDNALTYKFCESTYNGNLHDHVTILSTHPILKKRHQLCIKLSSDRFQYTKPKCCDYFAITQSYESLNQPLEALGYYHIKQNFTEQITTLIDIQNQLSADHIQFFYNPKHKRIDIEFRTQSQIVLRICFEAGAPIKEDKDEYWFDLFGHRKNKKM